MGFALLDRPNPNYQQYRTTRRAPISGVVIVHDAESIVDLIAPDLGAENVTGFITTRSDAGSYHSLSDSGGCIRLAPDTYETWHVAQHVNGVGYNWHAYGVSAACRTSDWSADPSNPKYWWTVATMGHMARDCVRFWLDNGFDPKVCARWLTRAQADARVPGLAHHGTVQPGDRSDAWATHPEHAALDEMFLTAIRGAIQFPNEEDAMSVQQLYDDAKGGPGGTIDDLASLIASKVRHRVGGRFDAERKGNGGPRRADGPNMEELYRQLDPEPGQGNEDDPRGGPVLRRMIDRIGNAVKAGR